MFLGRFELPIAGFGTQCSIQLSYKNLTPRLHLPSRLNRDGGQVYPVELRGQGRRIQDSNLCRDCSLEFSKLVQLTTMRILQYPQIRHVKVFMCPRGDSNSQSLGSQPNALSIKLQGLNVPGNLNAPCPPKLQRRRVSIKLQAQAFVFYFNLT